MDHSDGGRQQTQRTASSIYQVPTSPPPLQQLLQPLQGRRQWNIDKLRIDRRRPGGTGAYQLRQRPFRPRQRRMTTRTRAPVWGIHSLKCRPSGVAPHIDREPPLFDVSMDSVAQPQQPTLLRNEQGDFFSIPHAHRAERPRQRADIEKVSAHGGMGGEGLTSDTKVDTDWSYASIYGRRAWNNRSYLSAATWLQSCGHRRRQPNNSPDPEEEVSCCELV